MSISVNFTKMTTGTTNTLYDIAYGKGVYVVTGDRVILTSHDGLNWNCKSFSQYGRINSVVYGNGVFVALAEDINGGKNSNNSYGGLIIKSSDGENWSTVKQYHSDIWYFWAGELSFEFGGFCFYTNATKGVANIFYSSNGLDWGVVSTEVGFASCFYYPCDNKIVGFGGSSSSGTVHQHILGETYIDNYYQVIKPLWTQISSNSNAFGNIRYINEKWYSVGYRNIQWSDDLVNWDKYIYSLGTDINAVDVAYDSLNKITTVLVISRDSFYTFYATDGEWFDKSYGGENVGGCAILSISGYFYICGSNGYLIRLGSYTNSPPSKPYNLSHNATTKKYIGDSVKVVWGESYDVDNDPLTYELFFYNGNTWVSVIGNIDTLSFTHIIPQTTHITTKARYKIRAFDGKVYSDFTLSKPFEIGNGIDDNTLSSDDKDLGSLSVAPTIIYNVDDYNIDDELNITVKIDNVITDFIGNADRGDYIIELEDIWASLDEGKHILNIVVTDGKASSGLKYTFTKFIKKTYYPTISGYDTNLGVRDYSFIQTYTVDDKDYDTILSILVKLDNSTVIDIINNAIRNNKYSVDMSSCWDSLSKGVHKISIVVTDDYGNQATRIYNFYKGNGTNHPPTITLIG